MSKKHRKSNKGKIIGGFLGAIVLIGVIVFVLLKFDFIHLDILDDIFNKGNDLSKEVYCKEVNKENVKYDDGILYADNQVSLIANEGVKKREIKKLAKQYDAEIVGYIEFTGDYQLEFSEEKSYDELNFIVSELETDPNVESASLYMVDKVDTNEFYPSNDDYGGASWDQSNPEGNNWGVEAIQAPSAWDLKDEMSEVKIGLVDTNVDSDHEDLQFKKVWNSEYENAQSEHGTHVAGIMGAKFDGNKSNTQTGVTGVCPKPILYASSGGSGEYIGYMAEKCGLSRLILSGVKVINCSFGYNDLQIAATVNSENQSVKDKLDYLNRDMSSFLKKFIDEGYDFLIVTASGNSNGYYYAKVKESDKYPYGIKVIASDEDLSDLSKEEKKTIKKCENIDAKNDIFCNINDEKLKSRIIVVGADVQYENGYALSDFSSTGSRVDVLAPGENVYSTLPNNSYGALPGTSMAAPYVSGLAGMIYGINGDLSASQVKEIIINTATTDVRNTDKKMINARIAVELAKQYKGEGKKAYDEKGAFLCSVVDKQMYKSKQKSTLKDASTAAEKSVIEGVEVTLRSRDEKNVYVLKTNKLGEINYLVEPGTYDIEFKKEGYELGKLGNIEIESKDVVYEKVFMNKISKVTGKVVNKNGNSLEEATVKFKNSDEDISVETDSNGNFSKELKHDTYTVVVSKKGYETKKMTVEVNGTQKDLGEIVLSKDQGSSYKNYIGKWGYTIERWHYVEETGDKTMPSGAGWEINIKSIDGNNIIFDYTDYEYAGSATLGTENKNVNSVINNGKVEFTCLSGNLAISDGYKEKRTVRFYLKNGKVYVDSNGNGEFSRELVRGGKTKVIIDK